MGKDKSTTTETRNPYAVSQPLFDKSAKAIDGYLSDPRSTSVYGGPRTVGMSDTTRAGVDALANNQGYGQARDFLSKTLSGEFLQADNPHMQNLQRSVQSAVMPGLNASFAKSGMMGSTMHQGTLMRGLTDGMAAPLFQNYQNERGYQNQASSALPQLDEANARNQITAGQLGEGYDRDRIMADWMKFNEERDAPISAVERTLPMTQMIGGAGGTSTTTNVSQQSPLKTAAGIGMMGLGAMTGMPMFGGIGAGLSGMMGGGMQGARQGFAGMHNPNFWMQGQRTS